MKHTFLGLHLPSTLAGALCAGALFFLSSAGSSTPASAALPPPGAPTAQTADNFRIYDSGISNTTLLLDTTTGRTWRLVGVAGGMKWLDGAGPVR